MDHDKKEEKKRTNGLGIVMEQYFGDGDVARQGMGSLVGDPA